MVDKTSPDACAQAVDLPRVALLFLTKGDLFHHNTWRLWFQSAAGALPRSAVHAATCGSGKETATRGATELCTLTGDGKDSAETVVDAQHLFSVYVHAPPDVPDGDLAPLFQGRMVTRRLNAGWGTHQLVEAARNLLLEAWRDPLNQRFLLVSESDIPIYDPLTFYAQMMSEQGSRVNACAHSHTDRRRWTWRMRSAHLKAYHWRKSTQWFMLTREHAQVVLEDEEIYRRFEEFCWSDHDPDYRRYRDCFSDEHYMPTLFAVKKIQTESNCGAIGIAATNWSGGAHPKSYQAVDVTPALVGEALRSPNDGCDAESAWKGARDLFVNAQQAFDKHAEFCEEALPKYGSHLTPLCKMTARKFPKEVVEEVGHLFTDCSNGLHLLAPEICKAVAEEEEAMADAQDKIT